MKQISYVLKEDVPLAAETEILVIGAGPGGLCAAVTAARRGRQVALAEHYGSPGGMANVGEISPFMPNHCSGECLDRPLYPEWLNRMRSYRSLPAIANRHSEWDGRTVSRYGAMLAAEDMLLEAGVKLHYHHTFFDLRKEDGSITDVIFHGKSGLRAIRAKIVIDATGDGDVAARAGCRFEFGNSEGYCQPMTLCFKLCNVDKNRMPPRQEITALYLKAKEAGRIDCPREDVLWFDDFDSDVIHFNTTRVVKHNPLDAEDLSDAEIIARRQLRAFQKFLREEVPGFERAELHSVAARIGVRESRRILGKAFIGIREFETRAKFPDGIARVNYPIDIHNPSGSGTDLRHLSEDEYYEIPYGCIVPPGVSNLLIAGRGISVDHALHSSMRVMPPVCSIGQAAGMAAAMAVEKQCRPEELNGAELRAELKEFGANL